jgi:hypothetical protein
MQLCSAGETDSNATDERLKHHHDHSKELTMTAKTKLALAALLILGIASAAQAGGSKDDAAVVGGSALSALPCPALEGYPDCHPDARVLRMEYPTNSRQASPRSRQKGR